MRMRAKMQHLPHQMLILITRIGLLEALGGLLGASWRPLGGLLGPLGGLLEASWGPLGAPRGGLGAILGASCKFVKLSSPSVALECGLEATWSRLGVVLGPSWGHLGGILARLGVILGPSWGHLGASWGRLGASLGTLGAIFEPSEAS